jgi:hypothetical protein
VIDLPRVTLTQNEVVEIGHGRAIETRVDYSAAEIAAFDERGTLVAILAPRSRESLGPVKTFLT